ncbi:MAG: DNA polymerase III subunit delta [Deltaproteobacteria bacterium]|nr:MAG: DNA polymerase III subunit delta [Deltaproteobacteria bacterium]
MAGDLPHEDILKSLEKGKLAPFYLFYGPEEFGLEKALDRIRDDFMPASARDFNQEIFYAGEKTDPAEIINRARSLPFLTENRLIIVRRTENFSTGELETFLPYLERPVDTTCLIFIATKTDFRKSFYKRIKEQGRAVHFTKLRENQVVPWIRGVARELGLKIDGQASAYLHQIVGNSLRDLYAELEKLSLRYGGEMVGVEQVKGLAIHSRIYTIFELMNKVSEKNCQESLAVLNRFLEEEDKKGAPLRILGMLNRQIRIMWQTKSILTKGGQIREVAKKLGLPDFSAREFARHAPYWSIEELERGLDLLYKADGLLKSGSRAKPVLENLIFTLCA